MSKYQVRIISAGVSVNDNIEADYYHSYAKSDSHELMFYDHCTDNDTGRKLVAEYRISFRDTFTVATRK